MSIATQTKTGLNFTTAGDISFGNNLSAALELKVGSVPYQTFVTSTGSEKVVFSKSLTGTSATFSGVLTAGTTNYQIKTSYSAGNDSAIITRADNADNKHLEFRAKNANYNQLFLSTTGRVGIGDSGPDYTLDVAGTFRATGDAKAAQFYTSYDWTTRSGGINIGNQGMTTGAISFYDGALSYSASIYRDSSSVFFVGARGGTTTAGIAIATDGSVGIGTTAPTAKLHVLGEVKIQSSASYMTHLNYLDTGVNYITSTNGGATYFRGSNNGITTMTVKGDGNVGIGTSSPGNKLQVNGSVSITEWLKHDGDADTYLRFETNKSTLYGGGLGLVVDSGNVGIGTNSPSYKLHVASNAGYLAYFQNTSATDYRPVGFTDENNAVVGSIGYNTTTNVFSVGAASGTTEIKGGSVGIGTSSPDRTLTVAGTARVTGNLYLYSTGTANYLAYREWRVNTTSAGGVLIRNDGTGGISLQDGATTALFVGTDSTYGGRVGIGTSAPGAKLNVVGSVRLDGTTYASWFNYSSGEDTYIRGGKSSSKVHIADVGDDVLIANGGGSVGIGATGAGSYKLYVNGTTKINGQLDTLGGVGNTASILVGGTSNGHIRTRHVEGKESNGSGYDSLYLQHYSGNGTQIGGDLYRTGANTAASLGTASYRWANIYGVAGNFSGALTGTTATFSGQLTLQNDDATLRVRSNTTTTKGVTLRYNHSGSFGQLLCDEQGVNQLDMKYYALSHKFGRNDSLQYLTIDSAGNVAINNTGASARLDIRQDTGTAFRLEDGAGQYFTVAAGGDITMRGDLGVGASPSAWTSTYAAADFNTGGAIYGTTTGVSLASNLYFDGTDWTQKVSGSACNLYAAYGGQFFWYTAANSPTPGLTTRMKLDTTGLKVFGNLGVGAAPHATHGLYVQGSSKFVGTINTGSIATNSNGVYNLGTSGNRWNNIYSEAGNFTGALTGTSATFSGLLSLGGTGSLGSVTTNQKILANFDGGYSTNNSAQNKVIGFIGTTVSSVDVFDSSYGTNGELQKNFYLGLSTGNSYFNAAKFVIVQGGVERFKMAQGGNSTFNEALTVSGITNLNGTWTNFGGGYGATGVSISNTGNIQANGTLTVDGALTATTVTTNSGGGAAVLGSHLDLGDNQKARFGAGDDLQIYHDGSTSFIKDAGTGNLEIWADGAVIIKSGDGTETKALFDTNGSVDLYYNNSKKLATASTGVTITGTVFPATNLGYNLGSSALRWNGLYANTGNFSSSLTVHGYSYLAHDTGSWVRVGNVNVFKKSNAFLYLGEGGFGSGMYAQIRIRMADGYSITPYSSTPSSTTTLGESGYRWPTIYGVAGNFSGALTGTSATFSSYIRANYGIQDDSGSYGTSGQVLKSGGTGVVNWANESGGGSGSGTVNTGSQYEVAYYSSGGTTVDDSGFLAIKPSVYEVLVGNGTNGELNVGGTWGQTSSANRLYVKGYVLAGGLIDKSSSTYFIKPSEASSATLAGNITFKQTSAPSLSYTDSAIYCKSASGYGELYGKDGFGYETELTNGYSDYRLKTNIATYDPSSASGLVKAIAVKRFKWAESDMGAADRVGFIAHEVQEAGFDFNEAIKGVKDGTMEDGKPRYQKIDLEQFVPVLWAALQDALKRIEVLEGE